MGNKNSGQPPSEASLAAWRAFWYESGQNNSKTAEEFKVDPKTVARYRKDREWDKWADEVQRAAADDAVMPQARRVLGFLKTIDKRRTALDKAAGVVDEKANISGEIGTLAKTSQLLTGGATDRIDLGDAIRKFLSLPRDEQDAKLAELRTENPSQ